MACRWNCTNCYRAAEKATAIYNLNQVVDSINNDSNYGSLRAYLELIQTYTKLFMKCEKSEDIVSNINKLDQEYLEAKSTTVTKIQSRISALNEEKTMYENAAAAFHAEKEEEERRAYEEYLARQQALLSTGEDAN